MTTALKFEADFKNSYKALRGARPALAKQMRRALVEIAAEVAKETRPKLPSGMQAKGKSGIRWGFYGSKGAYMAAGGKKSPQSWAGAWTNPKGFRHPVYPRAGSDRKTWNWGPNTDGKAGKQYGKPILRETWDKRRPWALQKTHEAIVLALREADEGDAAFLNGG